MDVKKINTFLEKRSSRVTYIEIANTIYQTIAAKDLKNTIHHPELDNFKLGFTINYFAFTQKTLVDFMFTNLITVIGSYHIKSDSLKAWQNIPFLNESDKNEVMLQLKEIRSRYAPSRNNFICHINDDMENCSDGVLTQQINEDIVSLRSIFNIIRRNNNLPIVITPYSPLDHYPVIGINELISIISNNQTSQVWANQDRK